jgi:EmrB/QacA subfamily drug resistance transporter
MGSFVASLDATVVNVALPSISADLGGGLAGQQWVSNAYLLTLGSLILVGGSLGDVYGERRVFSIGVGGFGVASVLCAAAPTIELLIGARALQGIFGALLTPSALAVIVATFAREERGKAIGTWTAWSGIAMVVGPFVGGWLVDVASWRWIFALNVPFIIATLALVAIALPRRGPAVPGRSIDWLGAAMCAIGLAGPVYALIEQPRSGWLSAPVLIGMAGGGAMLAAFVLRESRCADPMLPFPLFRHRNFSVANIETLAVYAGLGGGFFLIGLYLQQVAGYDALQAGIATLPTTAVMFLLSGRFGALADRFGPRFFMGVGPLMAAGGMALIARAPADLEYASDVLPGLMIFSFGLAMTVAPLTTTVLADADESNAGIASAVNNAIARVAGLLAIAVIGAVASATFASTIGDRLPDGELSPAGRVVVADARERTFLSPDVGELPEGERQQVAGAIEGASVDAFRVGIELAAAMIACGGLLGLAGIRNAPEPV